MSDKRLAASMAMMERESDSEALNACRMATRMLAARGLKWTQVAELITGRKLGDIMAPDSKQGPATRGHASADYGTGFGASASQAKPQPRPQPKPEPKPQPRPQPKPEPKPKPKPEARTNASPRSIAGRGIPATIVGRIDLVDTQEWGGGRYLNVTITAYGDSVVYGPMSIFDDAAIEMALNAAEYGTVTVKARVRQCMEAGRNPIIDVIEIAKFFKDAKAV